MIDDIYKFGTKAAKAVNSAIAKVNAGNTGSATPIYSFNERKHCTMSEMKVDVGQGFRVYFGKVSGKNVVVGVGEKKSQKSDISIARKILESKRHGI